ncbi:MAG: DUF6261 family protein [Bacteroidota bacterium]
MIATIRYQKLWVVEFIQFLRNIISICRSNDPAGLGIDTDLAPLEVSLIRLDALFKNKQGSDLTKEIIILNKRRNNAIKLLTSHAKGYSRYHFEDTRRKAAKKIYSAITRYGRFIYRLNYQAKTATLSNLVNDLLSDAGLAEAVDALDLHPLVNELKTSNELFNDKYLDRIDEMSERPAESASGLRNTAMGQYRKLVKMIEARAVVSGPDRYQDLIKELNGLIERYNKVADSRGRNEEAEAEGEADK